MRKLSGLIRVAFAIGVIGMAGQAQQSFPAAAPQQSVCDDDAARNFVLIEEEENGARTVKPKISPERHESDRKLTMCRPSTFATVRENSATSSIGMGAVRRPTWLLSGKENVKTEHGNPLSSESSQDQAQPSAATEAQELAKKLSNPVASLISLPMQSNFDVGMGDGSGWRYTLNVQPVIPIALSPNWNLISRTIIPIIHQGNVTGPNTSQSGLGDTVQSLFFSPNKTEPFIWAVGPVILIPTATDAALGAQKWGLGPTALALKQKKGWTYGVLANHIWSVAGKSNRAHVNATFVQPFLSYSTKDAWTYSLNTESTYDWNGGSWSIPINPFISKLVRFGKQPISFGGGVKCWVTTPTGGPEACGLRIVVTALFPKK